MKRFLAYTIALTLSVLMFASCGGDSGNGGGDAAETTTTAPAETTAETTTAAPETEAPAETMTEAPVEEGPEDFTAIKDVLQYYDNASLKFNLDTDVSKFVYPFNQPSDNKLTYRDENGQATDNPYTGEERLPGEEGYGGNEAIMDFSVQEVGGIPMMRVREVPSAWLDEKGNRVYEETDKIDYLLRKFNIDLDVLFKDHEEDMKKIFSVKMDLICVARNAATFENGDPGDVGVYWVGGEFGTHNVEKWSGNLMEFSFASKQASDSSWVNQWAYTAAEGRPGIKGGNVPFGVEDNEHNWLFFQTWASVHKQLTDFYVVDILFEDEEGNVIPVPEENIPGGAEYEADNGY